MILSSSSSSYQTTHTLWFFYATIAYVVLSFLSARMVRQGKPAIPKHILILIPLALFMMHLQTSLPMTFPPRSSERSPDERSYDITNNALRHDLDRAIRDLDELTGVICALVNLFWLAGIIVISKWLTVRLDDRNWIHGGIRPPLGIPIDSENPPER